MSTALNDEWDTIDPKCPPSLIAPLIQIIIDETRKACKKDPVACGFNTAENAYEPLKLMQAVMAKTNEICLRYLDNSMLCSLPPPGPPFNVVSVSAARNKRIKMEDKHVVINDLNTMFNIQDASPSSYYAIFDGHAGLDAAAYSAAHLHQFLAESKHFATDPKHALRDAFCKTDSLFVDKCTVDRRFSSGTTAVCALHRPKEKKLYIAWVGDSQALLVNQGRVLQCVHPHKPCREDEKLRIENEGGFVSFWGTWRVMGQLAVSRAIGDATYKPYVTAIPDIREIPLDGGEDFLILACDGLWDFLSEDDTAKTVYNMVCDDPDKPDLVGERLVQLSKESGSTDNISVIVVFLRDTHVIAAEARVWGAANRNDGTSLTTSRMDTSLDNANNTNTNPFANSNGAEKNDGLLLNLSERFNKQNGGSDLLGSSNPACGIDLFNVGSAEKKGSKSNGKRLASEFEDDEDGDDLDDDDDEDEDLGPETDVDAVDDLLSGSIEKAKAMAEGIVNNNPEGSFNPFVEKHEVEKAAMEIELDLQKQQTREFDEERSPREETPTPPADAVHDVGGLVDNAADSGEDSDDEWNYIKGEEANKENISPVQPDQEVADILEEAAEQNQNAEIDPDEETMSQLNPNAAEFVPVSPTRSVPSPCLNLLNDPVVAQSPKRPAADVDIFLPADRQEFENEVKLRPSEVDDVDDGSSPAARAAACTNGHDTGDATDGERKKHPSSNTTTTSSAVDLMENLLNGKNLDEIPEFQPSPSNKKFSSEVGEEASASAPVLLPSSGGGGGGAASANDEFHFGPNAAPFSTPTRSLLTSQSSALDQSEAGYSTRAVYGDDTSATLETSFEQDIADLEALAEEEGEDKENYDDDGDGFLSKERRQQQQRDPMSMSFYQDDSQTSDVLDLNKVQVLPDNIDDFLSRPGDDPPQQSKWEEHDQKPSSPFDYKDDDLTLDNEARLIQTTDLDKPTSGSRNFDDEKELESPATPNNDRLLLLGTTEEEEEEDEVPQQRGAGDFVNLEAPKVDDLIAVSPVPYAGEREAVRSPEVPIAEGTAAAKSSVPSPVAEDNIISAAPTSPLLQTIEDHFAATSPIPQLNAEPQNADTSSLLEPQKVSTLGEHGDEDNNEGQKSPPLCSTPSSMGSQISCDELEPREPIYEDNNEDLLKTQEPTRDAAPDVLPSQQDNLLSNVGRVDETLAQPEASSAAAESGNIDDEQREKTGDDLLCGWVPPVPSRRTKSPDVVEDLLSRQQQYQHNESEQQEDNLLCELTGSRSPLEPERKDELSIESSHDDVTSSVKDDLAPSSPGPSPLPQDHHGEVPEEPLTQEVTSTTTINTPNTNEDLKEATLLPSPTREHQTSFCPMVSTPKSAVTETESVATTADVNSFLNRSLMGSDVSSLMSISNNEQQQTSVLQPEEIAGAQTTTNATSEFEAEVFGTTATSSNVPVAEQQLPVLEPQHVELKTETIAPEYAEQTLLLSSEPPSRNDRDQEASSGPSPAEEPTKEPAPTTTETPIITPSAPPQEEVEEASNKIETSTVVATTAAAAAAAVGVASAVAGATKVGTEKKTSAATASTKTKTPVSSASAKKTTTTTAAAASKGKPSASPRTTSGKSATGAVATTTGPSNKAAPSSGVGANKTPTTATSKASARPITRPGLGGARTTANVEGSAAPLAKKTSAPALSASKTSSTTATAATGTRPGTTSAPAARPRAAASRPATAAAAGKTGADKKPQLNGGDNAKPRPHSTSTTTSAFRRSTETSATSRAATTTSSARTVTSSTTSTSAGTKSSPTKPLVPRTSLTSAAAAPAKSSPRTSTGGAGSTAAAPKQSPNVLGSRVGPAASRSTTTKPTTLKTTNSTATKTTYSPKPRPASSTATATTTTTSTTTAKPRVPLSKTTTTGATSNNRTSLAPSVDAQKQIKDSVNKLTAATRTTTSASSTRTSSSTAAAAASRTTTSTHKTESKTAGNRTTVSKTTAHTKTSTASLGAGGNNSNKKPQEIVRNIKTKTTKIEKPQQIPNGVSSTIVTEQITTTIVNDAVSANNEINNTAVNVNNDDDTPLLVKDNSPVDNKLIVETATTNNAAVADLTTF